MMSIRLLHFGRLVPKSPPIKLNPSHGFQSITLIRMYSDTSPPLPTSKKKNSVTATQEKKKSKIPIENISAPIQRSDPKPVRSEFSDHSMTTAELENLKVGLKEHRKPLDASDYVALGFVKLLRIPADAFFAKRYLNRAVVLETVAAVPGMVAGMWRHLRSLRKMQHDGGWIAHLLTEADNERMHLMIWMKVCQPSIIERSLVGLAQAGFFLIYWLIYVISSRTAHRIVGYLEEEAIISYTLFLEAIDHGDIPNTPAPIIAMDYYNLPQSAKLRDVVLAVRADEAKHRDVNHHLSDRIRVSKEDLNIPLNNAEQGITVKVEKDI